MLLLCSAFLLVKLARIVMFRLESALSARFVGLHDSHISDRYRYTYRESLFGVSCLASYTISTLAVSICAVKMDYIICLL